MYKHLLIATDGSDLAQRAVEQGLALAKALEAKATAVFVTESWVTKVPGEMGMTFPIHDYEQGCAESAKTILGAVAKLAEKHGVVCETKHVRDQFPADGIISAAKSVECDLIVMASHGRRGLSRLLLGSQANQVVTHSSVPVLIVR